MHGKFIIVLDLLVTTTSTDTLASKGTLNAAAVAAIVVATLKEKLGKQVTTVSCLNPSTSMCVLLTR